jgi:hypothetical protein
MYNQQYIVLMTGLKVYINIEYEYMYNVSVE